MNNHPRKGQNNRRPAPGEGRRVPPPRKKPPSFKDEVAELFHDLFDRDTARLNLNNLGVRIRIFLGDGVTRVVQSKESILKGFVVALLLVFLALLQTTLFGTIRPFGGTPDLMLSFAMALAVTEGRKWGAVWGIIAGVVIESLGIPELYLMPLLYMTAAYFTGVICRHYLTESAAVRGILALCVIPFKCLFSWVYTLFSPAYITGSEAFFEIILPEAAATLLLSAPVHLLVFLCMKPFHRTRADMVADR